MGRLFSAALRLDDGRISEAHALVSLRGDELQLLALRGRFAVGGQSRTEVTLTPGLEVHLAKGLVIKVVEVAVPTELLAVEGQGFGRRLLRSSCSLKAGPPVEFVPGLEPDAAWWIWSDGARWRLQRPGQPSTALEPGDSIPVGTTTLEAVPAELREGSEPITTLRGGLAAPLTIVAHYDTVHLQRADGPPAVLDGISARLISELVVLAAPTPWEVVARELWNDASDRTVLRRRWDMALIRLRKRLDDARVRPDLIRVSGTGIVELALEAGDLIVDKA